MVVCGQILLKLLLGDKRSVSHDVQNSFLRPFVPVRYLYVLMKGQTVSKGGKKSSSFSKCQSLAMCVCVKENKWNLHMFVNVTFNVIRTN